MARQLKPCGTPEAYYRHRNHGEKPCDPCRRAFNERCREKRAERAKRPFSEIPHGESGYINWDCRCQVCTEAGMAKNARRPSRRKAGTS